MHLKKQKNAEFGIIWLVGETQCNVTTIKWLTQNLSCQAFISHQSQDFRGGGCCHCCHTQLHRGFHFATSWSSCPGAGGKEIAAKTAKKGAKKEWDHRNLEKTLFETLFWVTIEANEFRRGNSKMGHASYSPCTKSPPLLLDGWAPSFGLQDVPSVWTPQSGLGRPLAVHRPPPAMTQFFSVPSCPINEIARVTLKSYPRWRGINLEQVCGFWSYVLFYSTPEKTIQNPPLLTTAEASGRSRWRHGIETWWVHGKDWALTMSNLSDLSIFHIFQMNLQTTPPWRGNRRFPNGGWKHCVEATVTSQGLRLRSNP